MPDRSMWGGDGYDRLMGRWSRMLAPQLVRFAKVQDGDAVLDVGCGTGSLTRALLDVGPAVRVTAIDASPDYIEIAGKCLDDRRVRFEHANAESLPYPDDSFDKCVSLLVMNFVPDAARAATEMRRVTRTGGTVAAAVWDYGDGMEMLRLLWDEAASIDGNAMAKHERNMPLCRQGELAGLWNECGLGSVEGASLTIRMEFPTFDDYWTPFLTGIGPSGSYVSGLSVEAQTALRDRLCAKLAYGSNETPFTMNAKAWAVRGVVAG